MKYIFIVFAFLTLFGCGTVNYVPEEMPINKNKIGELDIHGNVKVVNIQNDNKPVVFFSGTSDWVGNYKVVTEHLKQQLQKEININRKEQVAGSDKSIEIKVTKLLAEKKFFHFTSEMDADYKLGNGQVGTIHISLGSTNNMWGVLNGTIAHGVIEILKEPKVKQYLKM